MKIRTVTPVAFALFAILIISACKKEKTSPIVSVSENEASLTDREKLAMQIFGKKKFEFNENDSVYLNALKRLSKNFNFSSRKPAEKLNGRITSCNLAGGDSTYGWYSDPDSVIIEGPHKSAITPAFESAAENCIDVQQCAIEANQYLISEGYADLADAYYGSVRPNHRYLVIHAANALIELKSEFILQDQFGDRGPQTQAKLVNCILQAVGFAELTEISANWATMSRAKIIKAVGKLAAKHLNWLGVAVAVVSFIDCMWG